MSNFKSSLIMMMGGLLSSFTFAATPTFQPPAPAVAPQPATPPLSASDFKNQVNSMSQKAQQDLMQQTQANLRQQNAQMPLPNAAPTAPNKSVMPAPPPPSTPPAAPKENNNHPTEETTEDNGTAPQAAATPAPVPPSPPKSMGPASTAAPNGGNQVYTGFRNNHDTTPSNSQSGGWNIKY